MSRSSRLALAGLACALALVPAAARAEVVEPPVALASGGNGITAGADGNVYVVETFNQSVAVLSPTGQMIRRVTLPGAAGTATSAALGPDGRVWVAIGTGAGKGFQKIDTSGGVTPQVTSQTCGPVGMAKFNDTRMLFTAPDPADACGASHGLGGVNGDGSQLEAFPTNEDAYDLVFALGKAFVPDYDGNVVRRYSLPGNGAWGAAEATFPIPVASGAQGIELGADNNLYVTMFNSGNVVRIDPFASSGTNAQIVASNLTNPFGMAVGADGAVYVASKDARILRIAQDGSQRFIALPAGFAAQQVAKVGNDIWVTDNNNARVIRIRNAGLPEPQPPVVTPPVTTPPVIPPVTTKPIAKPKVADVVSLASPKKCLSKRRLTLTVRKPKSGAAKVSSIKVTIGKGKAKTYTAKKLKVPVTLTGLPKGTFKVKLSVKLSDGKTLTETRTYKTCATKAKKKR
ncbi:Vgb family protein [Baekduia sp. Peel2402]|uniref:Vgb family protein n=1 Tax=Baekduia sp. Peel2402 TaxID=3458296 RepID=UPI00403EB381